MFKLQDNQVCIISKNTEIEGNILLNSNCIIEGKIHGTIRSNKSIIVNKKGLFEGKINSKEISVHGRIKGNFSCESIVIYETGLIEGDIWCEYIEIYEGGQFVGVRHKPKESNIKEK